MKPLQEMTERLVSEILDAYKAKYYNYSDLAEDIECSRYEAIIDWAELCSEKEYNELVNDPKIYNNIYDEAFDRAKKAALIILE